jgi:hypothetical protein
LRRRRKQGMKDGMKSFCNMDKGRRDREDMLPVDVGEEGYMDPDGYILGMDALRGISTLFTIKKSAKVSTL